MLSSTTTIDLTPGKGGQNGFTDANGNATYASNGGSGRLVVLDNTAATTAANVTGAPSGLVYDQQGNPVTTGTLVRNASYTAAVSTPRIVGLSYGAGTAGLMDDRNGAFLNAQTLDLDSSRAGVNNARDGAAPGKALIAVARYATMKDFAAATGGQVTLDQDYSGYDVLVVANISDAGFSDVKLGIGGETAKSLVLDGFLATTSTLGRMLPGDVWVTLVRESDTTFSVEATTAAGTATLDGRSAPVALAANGQWSYVSAPLAGAQTTANLQGLDQILVNGDRIYALQSSTGTLYVLNADGSVRQSFVDGDTFQVSRFGAAPGALGATAMAIIDTRLVVYSGDAQPGTTDPWGSVSKYSFSIAANGDLKLDGARSTTLTATDKAAYSALDTSSATFGSFSYTINNTTGALEVRSGSTLIQTLVEGQGGVRGLAAAMDVVVTGDADGKYVIVGNSDGTLSAFQRDKTTGLVTARALQVARDGLGGARGLAGITDIALGKLDGTTQVLYVASEIDPSQGRGGFATFSIDLDVAPKPLEISATHTGVEKLDVVTGAGADRVVYASKVFSHVAAVTIDTGAGADQVSVLDAPASASQTTTIRTGSGADTVTLASDDDNSRITVDAGTENDTISLNFDGSGSQTVINGDAGDDRIVLRQTRGASVTVSGGEGADIVAIHGGGIGTATTVSLRGGNPTTVPGDTLQVDKGTTTVSTTDPLYRSGTVTFTSNGTPTKAVSFSEFEAYEEILAPTLSVSAATIDEGQNLTVTIDAQPRGSVATPGWTGRFGFDLDGDGLFTDHEVDAATGSSQVTIAKTVLQAFGIVDDGAYTIQVRATNASNLETVTRSVVTVRNVNPTITASADQAAVTVGQALKITFGATGEPVTTDVPTAWRIDWGDGTIETFGASVRSAVHAYAQPGAFSVKVGQFDNDNPTTPIWSGGIAVTASLPAPQDSVGMRLVVGDAGQLVPGSDLVLRALDVVGSPTAFEWSINGTVITGAGVTGATTARATIAWSRLVELGATASATDYTITATAKYGSASFSRDAVLSVGNVAPTISALTRVPNVVGGVAQPVREGDAGATVRVTGATDSTAYETGRLSYVFLLPDGSTTAAQTSTDFVVPASALRQSGAVQIGVKAVDAQGLSSSIAWLQLDVLDVAPTITVQQTGSLVEGSAVTLAIKATDPGFHEANGRMAGDLITAFRIDWGDGSSIDTVTVGDNDRIFGAPNMITVSASHVYADEKRDAQGRTVPYTVTITAVEGARSTAVTRDVAVTNAAPILSVVRQNDNIFLFSGDTFTLSGSVYDAPRDGQVLTIDWGDGSRPQTLALAAGTTSFSLAHVYDVPNRDRNSDAVPYQVTVVAQDKDGAVSATASTGPIIVRGGNLSIPVMSLSQDVVTEGETFAIVLPVTGGSINGKEAVEVDLGDGREIQSHVYNSTTFKWEPVANSGITYDLAANTITIRTSYPNNPTPLAAPDDVRRFTISAVVWSLDGVSTQIPAATIGVRNADPTLSDLRLNGAAAKPVTLSGTVNANPTVTGVALGQVLTLTGSFADQGLADTVSIAVDWGDGVVVRSTDANSGIVVNAGARTFTATRAAAAATPSALVDGATLITVTARDNDGGARSSIVSYRLANAMPVITAMTASPTAMVEGNEVLLSLDITDPDAGGAPTVSIDWGDGTTSGAGTITGNAASGFRYVERHTYAADPAGTATDRFAITATVRDAAYTVTRSTSVTVTNGAPGLEDVALVATAQAGDTITLSGRVTDAGLSDRHLLSIDWGDGTTSVRSIDPGQRQFSIDKAYDKASSALGLAAYAVRISVVDTDDAGSKAVVTRTVAVGAPAATAAPRFVGLDVPATVVEGGTVVVTGEIADAGTDATLVVTVNWGDAYLSQVTATRDTPAGPYRFTATAPAGAFANGAPVAGVDTTVAVTVEVRNGLGVTTTASRMVTVTNAAPAVGPLAVTPEIVPNDGALRGQVTLRGTVTDPGIADALTVEIDWNDGTAKQTVSVDRLTRAFVASHTYAVSDPLVLGREAYRVAVTAVDDASARSQVATLDVRLKDLSPVIDRLTATAGREGASQGAGSRATVTVAATNISRADQSLLRFNIDIGNDNSWDLATWQTGATFTIDQDSFYATSGVKSVRVGVRDGDGRIRTAIVDVSVVDVPPSLATSAPSTTVDEGQAYTLKLSADDPSAADVITSWTVDWGDGTTSVFTPANTAGYGNGWNLEVSHVYADDNRALDGDGKRSGPTIPYQVKVKATGTDAGTLDAPGQAVTVSNRVPVFVSAATQGPIVEGGAVRLTGSFTDAGVRDGQLLTVDWGDGSVPATLTFLGADKSFSLTHVMAQDGSALPGGAYAVRLTLVDSDGGAAVPVTIDQVVTNAAPVFDALTIDRSTIDEGGKVVIRGSFTDAGANDRHTVVLTFGDGTSVTLSGDQIQSSGGTRSFVYEKTFTDNGAVEFLPGGIAFKPFTVKAAVSDEAGGTAERSVDVVVNNVDPVIADLKVNGVAARPGGVVGQPNGTVILGKDGGTVTVTGRFYDPGTADAPTLVIDWNDGTASRMSDMVIGEARADGPLAGWRDFTAVHVYGGLDNGRADPFVYNAMLILEDKDGGTAAPMFDVELANPTPIIRSVVLTPAQVNEGDLVTATVTFSDDDVNNLAVVFIRWGTVGGQSLADTMSVSRDPASGLFTATASRLFGDNTGLLQPLILVNDSDNLQANARTTLTVANVAPSDLRLSLPAVIDEGSTATLSGSFADPGLADAHTVVVAWSDGVREEVGATRDGATGRYLFTASRPVADEVQLTASVLVTDKDGAPVSGTVATDVRNVAPAIINLSVPGSLAAGGRITVSGTVTDPGLADAVSLVIDWGDGSGPSPLTFDPATGAFSASKTYVVTDEAVLGRNAYTVTLRAADNDGGVTSLTRIVSLKNVDPVIEGLSVTPVVDENGVVELTGRVADANAGDTHQVTVTWGDGTSETVAVDPATRTFTTAHRYADDAAGAGIASGRYTVGVTATDGQGASGSTSLPDAVEVRNLAPTLADVTVTPVIEENGVVTLTGRVVDAVGNDTHQVTVTWGDGASETVAVDPATRTFTTTHRYADDAAGAGIASGRYTVGVTATDGQGASGSTSLPDAVEVRNLAPTLSDVTVTPVIDENGVVTLTARVVDAGGNDTHQVTVTWGDGASETVAVDPQTRTFTTTHRYADDAAGAGIASGRYTVGVTVTDGQGASGSTSLPDAVEVRNLAPTLADVTVTPVIDENGVVTLTGRVIDAGGNDTHQVTVTWGDGASETVAVDPATRTFTTTHRYADDAAGAGIASGRYTVGVTATDGQGASGSMSLPDAVEVRNLAPTLSDVTVTPVIDENGVVTLTGRVVDAGGNDTHQVTVTWGDGTSETVAVDPATRTFTTTHRYADDAAGAGIASGRYTVGVTVTDGQGASGSTSLPDAVEVRNVAPTIVTYVASTDSNSGSATLTATGTVADPGVNDSVVVEIDWGDGTSSLVPVDRATGQFSASRAVTADAPNAPPDGRWSIRATAIDNSGARSATREPQEAVLVARVPAVTAATQIPPAPPAVDTTAAAPNMTVAYSGASTGGTQFSWGSGPPPGQTAPQTQSLPPGGSQPPGPEGGSAPPPSPAQDSAPQIAPPTGAADSPGPVSPTESGGGLGDAATGGGGLPADPLLTVPEDLRDLSARDGTLVLTAGSLLREGGWLALTARLPDAIRIGAEARETPGDGRANAALVGAFGMVAITIASRRHTAREAIDLQRTLSLHELGESWSVNEELPEDWLYTPDLGSVETGAG
ncbi:MAG: hypothetical protein ACT6XY_17285 [Phreatobacter sp.]|uniref:hypothetical protein n=1 Tax=Phreatobacter sp. TaxID=1966341 RepID=UPI0040358A10